MQTKVDTAPIKQFIKELDEQIANPTATPPVGTLVVWYRGARFDPADPSRTQVASLVTGVEGPGKLKLVAFPPFGMPTHKQGVLHISHPLHQQRNNSVSVDSGAWDYPDGVRPSKSHYDLHLNEARSRREAAEKQLAEAEAVSANGEQSVASGKR